jgi:hypothetical protein
MFFFVQVDIPLVLEEAHFAFFTDQSTRADLGVQHRSALSVVCFAESALYAQLPSLIAVFSVSSQVFARHFECTIAAVDLYLLAAGQVLAEVLDEGIYYDRFPL